MVLRWLCWVVCLVVDLIIDLIYQLALKVGLEMLFKERIVHFIEENSERFKLSYQSTLHSIQTLNVLEHSQLQPINAFIHHNWTHAKCLAINALIISANLYEVAWTINRRELIKAIT